MVKRGQACHETAEVTRDPNITDRRLKFARKINRDSMVMSYTTLIINLVRADYMFQNVHVCAA